MICDEDRSGVGRGNLRQNEKCRRGTPGWRKTWEIGLPGTPAHQNRASEGCRGQSITMAAQLGYDRHGLELYLENVGYKVRHKKNDRGAVMADFKNPSDDFTDHLPPNCELLSENSVFPEANGGISLRGGCCLSCGHIAYPVFSVCANCLSEECVDHKFTGKGKIYASTLMHVGPPNWKTPFVVAFVDLQEGIRVFGHVSADDTTSADIGRPVTVELKELTHSAAEPRIFTYSFRPMPSSQIEIDEETTP